MKAIIVLLLLAGLQLNKKELLFMLSPGPDVYDETWLILGTIKGIGADSSYITN